MSGPEAALAACRLVEDGAAMVLWGALGYLAALVPRDLGDAIDRRLQGVRLGAVAVAMAAAASRLPLEVATVGAGWADAVDPGTTRAVLLDTGVGRAWLAQATTALLLAATLAVPARRRAGATAAAAGLLLVAQALTGHAVMHEGWLGLAHRCNDALHVLAAGGWLGALLPLLLILPALDGPFRRDAGLALRRFSTAGHGAVALVLATGTLNTLLILGHWPLDWSSPYQALLAIKIGLVALMTALALVNRYAIVPRMARGHRRSVRALRRSTIAEIGLGVVALACVGVLGLLEPV